MRLVRIALCNVNATVGAVRSNVDRCVRLGMGAAEDGATIAVLPEQVIGGYAQEDLVQWRAFVDAQWAGLERFASETKKAGCAFAIGVTVERLGQLYNAAALVHRGKIRGLVPKEKLPLYNVFYEARTLARGAPGISDEVHGVPFGDLVFDLDFGRVALEVCEDIWSPDGPMRRRSYAGAELAINISASPYRMGIRETRHEMIATRAADNQATVAYANLVGANDGLVFDGGGLVAQNGRVVLDAPRYREGFAAATIDLDRTRRLRTENTTWRTDQEMLSAEASLVHRIAVPEPTAGRDRLTYPVTKSLFLPSEVPTRSPREDFCEDLLDTLALGVGDYFEKTGAFKTIAVALSGGRDSLLCMLVARRYLDKRFGKDAPKKAKEILRGFFMPSPFSSAETRKAAEVTAKEVGAGFAIGDITEAYQREIAATEAMLQPGEAITPMTRQNAQARVRSQRMWNYSNAAGALFLQTSNMSEKAVGYCTIGGDMEGALSVIANVPKTVVNYVLDYLLETTKSEAIRLTLAKAASAELAEDQEDEKDLMPFPVLDACFALYAGEKMSVPEVEQVLVVMFPEHDKAKLSAWAQRFGKLFVQSIYKWVQTPLSIHVGNLDLDRERALQLPVVQKPEW
jgi:NAD+ synthase (glutamine-hydrolysing)